jgi:predicted Zn-dependent peptidase
MLIDTLLWPNQPLGWDVAGSKETVTALSRQAMLDYLAHQYSPKNSVVSVAGNVRHEEVVDGLDQVLGNWADGSPQAYSPADNRQDAPRIHIETRDTEQANLCLAVRGLPNEHPHRFTLDLLNAILGEGMSSRLFTEIREKRGLAYTIHSYTEHLLDSGSVVIYAGVDPGHLNIAVTAILQEMCRLKEEIPSSELTRAKEFVKGRLMLRMEDSRSVSGWAGGQELLLGYIRTVEEVASVIDAISAKDLQEVARETFLTSKLSLSAVGPISNEDELLKLLEL